MYHVFFFSKGPRCWLLNLKALWFCSYIWSDGFVSAVILVIWVFDPSISPLTPCMVSVIRVPSVLGGALHVKAQDIKIDVHFIKMCSKPKKGPQAARLIFSLTSDAGQSCAAERSDDGCLHKWLPTCPPSKTWRTRLSVSSLLGDDNTLDSQQNLESRQLRRQMTVTEVSNWQLAKKNTMSC